jgi:hypothetical protein
MQITEFIMNINDLYKPALNVNQIKFYSQFLSSFTDKQLDELWSVTMESHTTSSPPAIGRLKEYTKQISSPKVINAEDAQERANRFLKDAEIFNTDLGRLSLRQGWADSYRVHCREKGIPSQGDDVLLEFQRGQQDANDAAFAIRNNRDPFSKALISFREDMVSKNEALKWKYKSLWDNDVQLLN